MKSLIVGSLPEQPALTAYILENGNILRAGKDSLELRDWNNNLIWSFDVSSIGFNQHHDIEPLPNGNILLVVLDSYDSTAMFSQGLATDFSSSTFRLDRIVEIEPTGISGATVVWEWAFYDHLIQSIDPTKPNYGIIDDHPELLDMNFEAVSESDFTHVNAVDYNADLDQIIISARHTNELYIIDHSTTTLEAASHTGGDSGKGGDFLWRWGNPQVYHSSFDESHRTLGKQHDCQWIESGLHEGKISVYNNESVNAFGASEIGIIAPSLDANTYLMNNDQFEPLFFEWNWFGTIQGESMSTTIKSGVQILPNNNALIMETGKGKIAEIDAFGNLVWLYEIPIGLNIFDQYEVPTNNSAFRATRYPENYIGFVGVDLTPSMILEDQNTLSEDCSGALTVVNSPNTYFRVVPNPANGHVSIISEKVVDDVKVFNHLGEMVACFESSFFDIGHLPVGVYNVRVEMTDVIVFTRLMKTDE